MRSRDDTAPLWPPSPRPRAVDVLGVGQNALDRIGRVERHPRKGEKQRLLDSHDRPGGQVATAVLACARLGLRCAYVGRIGDDDAGRAALAPLRAAGVDLAGVRRIPGVASQTAMILVDRNDGDRTILWHRAAELQLARADLPAATIEGARALLLDAGDPEAAAWAARVARAAGVAVILDADHYTPDLDELLMSIDFPLVSRGFADSFSENGSVSGALRRLVQGGARLAAVTLGDRGFVALAGDRWIEEPAVAVAVRDTTGAGDAFHGGFAWGLLEGFGARQALRAANAVAALNCRAPGAQGGLPARREVEEVLALRSPAP